MPSLMNEIGLLVVEIYIAHAKPINPVIWKTGPENVSAKPILWSAQCLLNTDTQILISSSFFKSLSTIPKGKMIMGRIEK